MQKQFTAENLARLQALYVELSFKGEQIDGKFGANLLNPFELLTQTAIGTLRNLLKTTRRSIQEMDDLDEWSMSDHQNRKKVRFEKWSEFLNLLVGYRLDQEEKAALRAVKADARKKLQDRIAAEEDKGKTVEDLKKELAALDEE